MIQFCVKYAIRQTPNASFLFAIQPVGENHHPDMDVVHVLEEIAHHVIAKGEI